MEGCEKRKFWYKTESNNNIRYAVDLEYVYGIEKNLNDLQKLLMKIVDVN